MLRIGITGGIGSGKSTVARVFAALDVPVYQADEAARRVMQDDPALRRAILAAFGPKTYPGGKLDRDFLGNLVFRDPGKLALLNGLVHPVTRADAARWMAAQTAPYALKEAALIFEAGIEGEFDYIIGVDAPEALTDERLLARGRLSAEKIADIRRNQLSSEEKMKRCDFVVCNDESSPLLPQVLALHERFLREASGRSPGTEAS